MAQCSDHHVSRWWGGEVWYVPPLCVLTFRGPAAEAGKEDGRRHEWWRQMWQKFGPIKITRSARRQEGRDHFRVNIVFWTESAMNETDRCDKAFWNSATLTTTDTHTKYTHTCKTHNSEKFCCVRCFDKHRFSCRLLISVASVGSGLSSALLRSGGSLA